MNLSEKLSRGIFYCLCGFALTIPFGTPIADACSGLALLLAITSLFSRRSLSVVSHHNGMVRGLLLFFGLYLGLIFLSPDIAVAGKAYWRYLNRMIPFILVLFFVKERKQLCWLLGCALTSICINNIYSIYEGTSLMAAGEKYIRTFGLGRDMLALAGFLLIYLPIVYVLLLTQNCAKSRVLYSVLLLIGLVALVFNATRIAWLVMALLLPIGILLYGKNLKKTLAILIVGCVVAGIVGYNIPFVQDRVYSIVDRSHLSNRGHYAINMSALAMLEEKPLLGWGIGQFPFIFNGSYIAAETKAVEGHISHAHNDTLTIGAETGIVGIAAFWFMFGSLLFYSLRNWYKYRNPADLMLFLVTLGAVLHGFTDTRFGMHQVNKLYFMLVAVYLNYRYGEEKDGI